MKNAIDYQLKLLDEAALKLRVITNFYCSHSEPRWLDDLDARMHIGVTKQTASVWVIFKLHTGKNGMPYAPGCWPNLCARAIRQTIPMLRDKLLARRASSMTCV